MLLQFTKATKTMILMIKKKKDKSFSCVVDHCNLCTFKYTSFIVRQFYLLPLLLQGGLEGLEKCLQITVVVVVVVILKIVREEMQFKIVLTGDALFFLVNV